MTVRSGIFLKFLCGALSVASASVPVMAGAGSLDNAGLGLRPATIASRPAEVDHGSVTGLCRAAVRDAEARLRLPRGLLLAIAQVESARPDLRQPQPWPWTVQASGSGLYFETKAEAVHWVQGAQARGITSIDAGCLQVNLLFHPRAFESLDEAFDPQRNADYAGRFLRQLYGETGDWGRAVGLYHSRTTTIAVPYQQRVSQAFNDVVRPSSLASQKASLLSDLAAAWRSTLGPVQPSLNPLSSDRFSSGRFSSGQFSSGQFSSGQLSPGQLSPGGFFGRQLSNGRPLLSQPAPSYVSFDGLSLRRPSVDLGATQWQGVRVAGGYSLSNATIPLDKHRRLTRPK